MSTLMRKDKSPIMDILGRMEAPQARFHPPPAIASGWRTTPRRLGRAKRSSALRAINRRQRSVRSHAPAGPAEVWRGRKTGR
jgi:hypothetical protein